MVLHFIKGRGDRTTAGSPAAHGSGSNADPRRPQDRLHADPNPTGYRYAGYFRKVLTQARALTSTIRRNPQLLQLLRGLDICNHERAIPNWVFVPLFRTVAETAREVVGQLPDRARPFRRTIHVGEDFVHPLTGLRMVAEAVRYFDLRDGDRLGHALALGVDFADWTRRAGQVWLRKEERLFDLVWEWDWCTRRKTAEAPQRIAYLDREIRRLGRDIFATADYTPQDVNRLMLHLHREDALRWVGFPDGIEDAGSGELLDADDRRLIRQYLTDGPVFERGQQTEPYPISDEGPILAALQAEVRREVGRRGITVEVNPSSNLLIGDFGDLRRHPFWRLAGPPGFDLDVPPVSICLGSDDPITFVTDIRHEYQLVYDAVLAGGASTAEALRWIDELRQRSLDVRFTVPFRVERTVRRSVKSHPHPFGNPRGTR